jgi:tetratricopeptide (TPR) repeat protein
MHCQLPKRLQQTVQLKIDENDLNNWGYSMIEQNKIQQAIVVFKLSTELFPTSANTFDSLAEAYASLGLSKQAIKYYESALKLTPINGGTQYLRVTLKALRAKD